MWGQEVYDKFLYLPLNFGINLLLKVLKYKALIVSKNLGKTIMLYKDIPGLLMLWSQLKKF